MWWLLLGGNEPLKGHVLWRAGQRGSESLLLRLEGPWECLAEMVWKGGMTRPESWGGKELNLTCTESYTLSSASSVLKNLGLTLHPISVFL